MTCAYGADPFLLFLLIGVSKNILQWGKKTECEKVKGNFREEIKKKYCIFKVMVKIKADVIFSPQLFLQNVIIRFQAAD